MLIFQAGHCYAREVNSFAVLILYAQQQFGLTRDPSGNSGSYRLVQPRALTWRPIVFFSRTGPNSVYAVISKDLSCHRVDVVGWLLVFSVHAVTVIAFAANHTLIPDENAYINLAKNLVQDGSYHLDFGSYWHVPGQPFTLFAPGWPFLLSIGYAVAGLTGCWVIMWLVWCLNSVLADRLASTLGFTRQWRWAFVGWVTFNPLFLFYHGHLMTESAVIGLNLALTAIGIRLVESATTWRVILFAAVAAAAHITRSQTMLTVIAVWLVAAVTIRWRRMIPLFLLFAVLHVGLLSPWLWRMSQVGGSPFSTELKSGINLYQYSGTAVDDPYAPGARVTLPAGVEMMTARERNRVLTQEALKQIVREPDKYFKKCLIRSFYLFSPVPGFYQVGRLQYLAILGSSLAFFHTFFVAAVVGLIRRRPSCVGVWLMVVALGVWYTFHIMVNASIRNRLPSDIWIAALAIVTWAPPAATRLGVCPRIKKRRVRRGRETHGQQGRLTPYKRWVRSFPVGGDGERFSTTSQS